MKLMDNRRQIQNKLTLRRQRIAFLCCLVNTVNLG